jgi:hypothetical protein
LRIWECRRFASRHLSLAIICLQAACAPFAHHGPWVRQGTSGDILTAGGLGLDADGSGTAPIFFGVDGALRYGIVPQDSTVPAAGLGLQVPALPFFVMLGDPEAGWVELVTGDIYVSALRTNEITTSFGFSGSFNHKLPYIQIGSKSPDPKGWYTTQALYVREDGFKMWLPSFTWVSTVEDKPRASHVTVGAGLGSDDGQGVYMFMVGITMEFHRRNARVR